MLGLLSMMGQSPPADMAAVEGDILLPPPPLEEPDEPRKLSDDEYIAVYQTMLEEAKQARKRIELQWDLNWALCNNQISYPNKLPWQSKGYIPKTAEMVDAKVALGLQALRKSQGRYFSAGPWGELAGEQDFANTVNRLLRFILTELDFDDQILPAQMVMAQLANSVMKTYVTRDAYGRLNHVIDQVPPWNFYQDPLSRGQYCIHVSWMDLSEWRAMALAPGSPYDRKVVLGITDDFREQEQIDEQARREGLLPEGRSRKMVQIGELWGNLNDPGTGERLHTNIVMTVVNGKHLPRRPQKNKFPGGRKPFVAGSVRRMPFVTYQKPPLSDVTPLASALNDFFNLTMDCAVLRGVPSFEAFYNDLEHPELLLQGYSPGKVFFRRHTSTQQVPVIRPVELGADRGENLRIYNLLQSELGNRVMSQAELGTPGGSKPTATEYSGKSQLTQQFTMLEAQELEAQILEPLFERMVANELWFRRMYRDDRQLQSVLDEQDVLRLESLSESERKDMVERMRIKVSGISEMMASEEMALAMDNLINRLGRAVKSDPSGAIAQFVNWKGMAEYYAEKSGISKRVVWMDPQQMAEQDMEQAQVQMRRMQMQQMMQAQMQPQPQQLPPGPPQEPQQQPQMQMIPGGAG